MNKNITNYPSTLDIDELWAAIEPQVDEINAQRKKKRKPFFLYWLTGAILLIGLVTGSFFLFSEEQTEVSQAPTRETPNSINQAVTSVEIAETVPVENQTTEATTPTKMEASPVTTSTEPTIPQTNNSTSQNITTVKKEIKIVLPIPANLSSPTPPTSNQSVSVPGQTVPNSIQEVVSIPSTIGSVEFAMTALSKLPTTKIGLKVPETELPELDLSIKNNERQLLPPLYVEKPTFSIEFQTGISAINRTLNSTGIDNSYIDTLRNLRNTFEAPLEALHANLLINAHFPSGFYVSSGVAFTQISEVYSNNSTQSETIIDPMGIQKRIVNLTGDTIDIIGPVASTVTSTFLKKYYNTYRMIDIPVFVGYQYDFGDWKTDFSLGVFANLLLATEGRIPNTPLTDLDLSTNGDDIYRSRVDYSLQFGIGVSKSLTDKLSIRINPTLRYYSRNFIKEDFGLEQRYLLFGGTIGLRMDL